MVVDFSVATVLTLLGFKLSSTQGEGFHQLPSYAPLNYKYVPPTDDGINIENTIILDEKFAVVWDRLVENLAREFFVINNISKESRIINVSYSIIEPEGVVDCGEIVQETQSRNGLGGYSRSTFTYKVGKYVKIPIQRNRDFSGYADVDIVHSPSIVGRANTEARAVMSRRET